MRTRQVEQRARPPQTDACGILFMRLISSSVGPNGTRTVGPPVYVIGHLRAGLRGRNWRTADAQGDEGQDAAEARSGRSTR